MWNVNCDELLAVVFGYYKNWVGTKDKSGLTIVVDDETLFFPDSVPPTVAHSEDAGSAPQAEQAKKSLGLMQVQIEQAQLPDTASASSSLSLLWQLLKLSSSFEAWCATVVEAAPAAADTRAQNFLVCPMLTEPFPAISNSGHSESASASSVIVFTSRSLRNHAVYSV